MAMYDPQMALLSSYLTVVAADLVLDAGNAEAWANAGKALHATRETEAELASVIDSRNAAAFRSIVDQWASGQRLLPVQDRDVLKRAMKAFRKSLKVTRLDAESSIGGGPMSSGRRSGIAGITPPGRYPREVWKELARQGRLIDDGHGVYELAPE